MSVFPAENGKSRVNTIFMSRKIIISAVYSAVIMAKNYRFRKNYICPVSSKESVAANQCKAKTSVRIRLG